jgi:uncharacterized protein with FMN-binding domain
MPSRGVVTFVGTTLGVVLVLSFKTPDATRTRTGVVALGSPGPSPSSAGSDTSASPSPASTPSAAGAGLKEGQFTGQDVSMRFGDVQVKITVSGGRITDISALQMPFDRQRSQDISDYVRQPLHDEVLQAQSAQIDTISGATYTSDAYAQSVQSVLDQARH